MKNIISIRNAAAMLIAMIAGTITAFADAPANDNFANAEVLTGSRISIIRTNVEATKETGEPDHALNVGGKSVWFKWTAPSSMIVNISTRRSGSNIDTLVHLYREGATFDTLTTLGSSNDVAFPDNLRSFFRRGVIGGTTYYIAVDGANNGQGAASGDFRLDIMAGNPYQGGDYDSDGITDLAVYRPDTSVWYTLRSSTGTMSANKWGTTGDVPLLGSRSPHGGEQFVFRPSTGVWYRNTTNGEKVAFWGTAGDIPVQESFGGELASNYTVFRPSEGRWYIYGHGGTNRFYDFGLAGDIPVPGRYSPDGVADICVYRPSNGVWYTLKRINGNAGLDSFEAVQFGTPEDKPVPGDYDGDGLLDKAVFRPSTGTFWVLRSSDNQQHAFQWGSAEDTPVTGDFDGDGIFDFAVFRPSTGDWYIFQSSNQLARVQHFGMTGDIPVTSNVR